MWWSTSITDTAHETRDIHKSKPYIQGGITLSIQRTTARIAALLAAPALALAIGAAPAQAANRYDVPIIAADGECMEVVEGNAVSGAYVAQQDCREIASQRWNLLDVGSHYFQVQSAKNPSLCLNNWEGGDRKGNYIRLYACGTTDDRLFNFVYDDGRWVTIQPKSAWHNCLNFWGGSAPGYYARLYDCNTDPNELLLWG